MTNVRFNPAVAMSVTASLVLVASLSLTDAVRPATWLGRLRNYFRKPEELNERIALAASREKARRRTKETCARKQDVLHTGDKKDGDKSLEAPKRRVFKETIYLDKPICPVAPVATLASVMSLASSGPPIPPQVPSPPSTPPTSPTASEEDSESPPPSTVPRPVPAVPGYPEYPVNYYYAWYNWYAWNYWMHATYAQQVAAWYQHHPGVMSRTQPAQPIPPKFEDSPPL